MNYNLWLAMFIVGFCLNTLAGAYGGPSEAFNWFTSGICFAMACICGMEILISRRIRADK